MTGINLLRDPIAALPAKSRSSAQERMNPTISPPSNASWQLKRGGNERATKAAHLVRREASEATNKVSAMKWRWEARR